MHVQDPLAINSVTIDNSAKGLRQKQIAIHYSMCTQHYKHAYAACNLTSLVGELQLNLESMIGCYQLK